MKIRSIWRHALVAATCTACLWAAPQANAALLVDGYANGSESFGIVSPVATGTFGAGGFAGTWNGTKTNFWCTELNEYIYFGTSYSNYGLSSYTTGMLSRLFAEVGGSAGAIATMDSSAAMQLAIWEIVYEGDSGPFDLGSGSFKVTSGPASAISIAQNWLTGLATFTGQAQIFRVIAVGNQDQVGGGTPGGLLVPEPSSMPLLGVGLLAAIIATRRRAQRAS